MGEIDRPGVGRIRAPASPLDTGTARGVTPAPHLGEHTDDLVRGLGLDAGDLRRRGIVE